MKLFNKLLGLLFLFTIVFSLQAAKLTIKVRSDLQARMTAAGYPDAANTLLDIFNTVANQIGQDVVNAIPADLQTNFLKQMAGAGIASNRGLGVDYASNQSIFSGGFGMGFGLGGATNGFASTNNTLPKAGLGMGASVNLGLNARKIGIKNFWKIDTEKLNLYANFMSLSIKRKEFSARTLAVGLHGQYKIKPSKKILPFKMLHWGGLDVSTGFDYTSQEAKVSYPYNYTQPNTNLAIATSASYSTTWKGAGELGITTGIFSIPIEISSNIQVLYLFTLYGGLGIDLNIGSTSSIANVTGDVSFKQTSAGPTQGAEIVGGTATLDLSETQSPTFIDLRFFTGLQANLGYVKLVTQVGWTTGDNYNFNMFIRGAY